MALSAVKAVATNDDVRSYSLHIDGKWTSAADGAVADDFNPATGALFARVAQAGRADAVQAVGPRVGRRQLLRAQALRRNASDRYQDRRVGKLIAVEAAKNLKKFTLEMRGKNPLIVLQDADVDYAVKLDASVSIFTRDRCAWPTRASLSKRPCMTSFVRSLRRAKTYKVGDPHDPQTVIGPLIRRSQCAFIDEHVADATAKDAKVLTGGTRAEEALQIANDTSYGLSAGLITNDLQKAMDLALRLESGMVHINDTTVSHEPHIPFGGIKNSGFGREGGNYSMEEMTEAQVDHDSARPEGVPILRRVSPTSFCPESYSL